VIGSRRTAALEAPVLFTTEFADFTDVEAADSCKSVPPIPETVGNVAPGVVFTEATNGVLAVIEDLGVGMALLDWLCDRLQRVS